MVVGRRNWTHTSPPTLLEADDATVHWRNRTHTSSPTLLEADDATVDPLELDHARLRAGQGDEHGLWIAPALLATGGHCSVDTYLELVDQTGRIIASGKRGRIPEPLAPILERPDIDVDNWLSVMPSHGCFLGTAGGALRDLITEATRRGVK